MSLSHSLGSDSPPFLIQDEVPLRHLLWEGSGAGVYAQMHAEPS